MRSSTRRAVSLVCGAVLIGYVVLVVAKVNQQSLPDFDAFYAVARALASGGSAAFHHLYSLQFQIAAESFLDRGPGRSFVEPFVAFPPAAWVIIPFTLLSIGPAFYLWDALGLGLCLLGTVWLARQERLGADATPVALAIVASYSTFTAFGEGQYDLLWPLCLALFTAAWYCTSRWGRWTRAAAASFLFTFKPDLLLLLVVPALATWRHAAVRAAAVCLAALAVITVAVVGIPGLLKLPQIESYTLFHRFPPANDETVLAVFWRLTGHGALTQELAWVAAGLALVGLTWAWWRNPPQTSQDWKLALTSTVCLSLLVAPHSLNHDLLLLAGPGVWTARALRTAGRDLSWLAFWMILVNAAMVLDDSTHLTLPIPVVPLVLLAAGVMAWRARRTLVAAPAQMAPSPESMSQTGS
ncbi:MAG TPA: glycosyltransferase 87 family protein [Candidatus Dormibacteraeota bacterium]|nr:glycosyltransferase 87 family protein [Candidatus Dormibacteraeota bacterium]